MSRRDIHLALVRAWWRCQSIADLSQETGLPPWQLRDAWHEMGGARAAARIRESMTGLGIGRALLGYDRRHETPREAAERRAARRAELAARREAERVERLERVRQRFGVGR